MAGLIRAFLNSTNYRTPLLRTVVPTVAAAFAIQGAVAFPSILAQTERYYDLSGSLTYLSCTALSLYLPVLRARAAAGGAGAVALGWPSILKSLQGKSLAQGGFWDWRQLVLSAAVGIWATRCKNSFLMGTDDQDLIRRQWAHFSSPASPVTMAKTPDSTKSEARWPNS